MELPFGTPAIVLFAPLQKECLQLDKSFVVQKTDYAGFILFLSFCIFASS